MRTSGRGSYSETLMFVAPGAIIGLLFLWWSGGPGDLLVSIDRTILRVASATMAWISALVT